MSSHKSARSTAVQVTEEDQSYTKESLGAKTGEVHGVHKILGIQWNFLQDEFIFNISEVFHCMEDSEPTKRNVVSMTARFFDPLGVVTPVTISSRCSFKGFV